MPEGNPSTPTSIQATACQSLSPLRGWRLGANTLYSYSKQNGKTAEVLDFSDLELKRLSLKRKTRHLPAKINCDESFNPTISQPGTSCTGLPRLPASHWLLRGRAIFKVQTIRTKDERGYLFIVTPFNCSFFLSGDRGLIWLSL